MYCESIGCEGVERFHLAEDRVELRYLVKAEMNVWKS